MPLTLITNSQVRLSLYHDAGYALSPWNFNMEEKTFCSSPYREKYFRNIFLIHQLSSLLGQKNVSIQRLKSGKPKLNPQLPSLSLSSKNNLLLIGLCEKSSDFGVDLENATDDFSVWPKLQGSVFNTQDLMTAKNISEHLNISMDLSMRTLFSIKESVYKATGTEPFLFDINIEFLSQKTELQFKIILQEEKKSVTGWAWAQFTSHNYIITWCILEKT